MPANAADARTAPAFTLAEHDAIAAWRRSLPRPLQVRIALDNECAEEVLEVHAGDWTLPLFFIAPRPGGGIELVDGLSRCQVLGSLEAALARVGAIVGAGQG